MLFLIRCNIGKQGVYYDEMGTTPILTIDKNVLTITTTNSRANSSLLIYEINLAANKLKNEIYLSANQATGKRNKNIFTFKLSEYKIYNANNYVFYWIDPDMKTTELKIVRSNNIK